MPLNEHSLIQT